MSLYTQELLEPIHLPIPSAQHRRKRSWMLASWNTPTSRAHPYKLDMSSVGLCGRRLWSILPELLFLPLFSVISHGKFLLLYPKIYFLNFFVYCFITEMIGFQFCKDFLNIISYKRILTPKVILIDHSNNCFAKTLFNLCIMFHFLYGQVLQFLQPSKYSAITRWLALRKMLIKLRARFDLSTHKFSTTQFPGNSLSKRDDIH